MRAAPLFLVTALLLAACGGGDGADDAGSDPVTADDSAADDGAADDGAADDSAADDSAAEDGAADDSAADDSGTDEGGPGVGDHWHAAYAIYVCGQFGDPIPDPSDPEGIHSHGDGVIHIHPVEDTAAGANATLGRFLAAVQVEVTDEGLFGESGSLEEGLECPDGPAEFKVARWTLDDLEADPEIIETDIADIRFTEDLEILTLAFVAPGAEIPLPPTISSLGSLSDVDPEDMPVLPPGYAVAVVEPPGAGAAIDGETPCPEPDGSSPRTTEFSGPPPMCIDPAATYVATFVTSHGDVVVELDTATTPETVNNFVVLALYHFYDDTQLFRTAPSIAIIQGGSPLTNGGDDPGPGYTIADEGDGYSYVPGDLAMARTQAPDSAGAQFFFSAGPETANLDGPAGNPDGSGRGTYVKFGSTLEGLDVLQEILALHVPDPALAGGGPSEPVVVEKVLIEQR